MSGAIERVTKNVLYVVVDQAGNQIKVIYHSPERSYVNIPYDANCAVYSIEGTIKQCEQLALLLSEMKMEG